MHNYKKLSVWKKSVHLATRIYQITSGYPKSEMYGITSQIRRNVVSISSNIAEGAGRAGEKEFKHFLNISYGSAFELETQLIISSNLEYLSVRESNFLQGQIAEIQKMLYGLIHK